VEDVAREDDTERERADEDERGQRVVALLPPRGEPLDAEGEGGRSAERAERRREADTRGEHQTWEGGSRDPVGVEGEPTQHDPRPEHARAGGQQDELERPPLDERIVERGQHVPNDTDSRYDRCMSWSAQAIEALEEHGRSSGARRAVVELLGRQDCCLTAQEIFDRLRSEGRRVGIATVYRVLDQLSEHGLVQRVDVGAGTALYEAALPTGEHHHHLVCAGCGKVEAFADEELEAVIHKVERRTGYSVAGHDVVLRGACGDCADLAFG
jgi:Fur family ferric uptake transcriptional regulator